MYLKVPLSAHSQTLAGEAGRGVMPVASMLRSLCNIVAGGAGSQPNSVAGGCRRCNQVSSGSTLPVAIFYEYFVQETEENWPTFSLGLQEEMKFNLRFL